MMSALYLGGKFHQAYARIGLAEISGRRVESFFGTQIGTRSRVSVFHNGVRREVNVNRAIRTERSHAAQKLDGLKFTAKFEFEYIADGKVVSGGKREGLEGGVVQVGIGGRETACSEG